MTKKSKQQKLKERIQSLCIGYGLSPAAKLDMIQEALGGEGIIDDKGNPTGEKTYALITAEEARKLLGGEE